MVIEIVGNPGSGKSSLHRKVLDRKVGSDLKIEVKKCELFFQYFLFVPLFLKLITFGYKWNYVLNLRNLIRTSLNCCRSSPPFVIDQGPVFDLVSLLDGNCIRYGKNYYIKLITLIKKIEDYRIVVLRIDPVLALDRIRTRDKSHRLKQGSHYSSIRQLNSFERDIDKVLDDLETPQSLEILVDQDWPSYADTLCEFIRLNGENKSTN